MTLMFSSQFYLIFNFFSLKLNKIRIRFFKGPALRLSRQKIKTLYHPYERRARLLVLIAGSRGQRLELLPARAATGRSSAPPLPRHRASSRPSAAPAVDSTGLS